MKTAIIEHPKDSLERSEEPIVKGDIVTIDDNAHEIEVFVVRETNENLIAICRLNITEARDDVYLEEFHVPRNSLIKLDLSFINSNGYLATIRRDILKNKPLLINPFG